MRKLRNIINGILWAAVVLYLAVVVLLQVPAIQAVIGRSIGNALSDKLGTEVTIGKINLGFLNRIIVDDVLILDQHKKDMLRAARISAKFDYAALLRGQVYVYSAQLFGINAKLYKQNVHTKPNFQFVLDSLASKDTTTHKPLDIKISTLIIRRGSIAYDRYDIPKTATFSPYHLALTNISAHVSLNAFKEDSINLNIRNIAFDEASGLHLKSLTGRLTANTKDAKLSNASLSLSNTRLNLGTITASYSFKDGQIAMPSLSFSGSIAQSNIVLSELSCFVPALRKSTKSLQLQADFSGTGNSISVPSLEISSRDGNISLLASGSLSNRNSKVRWATNIHRLRLSAEGIRFVADNFGARLNIPPHLTRMGNINYTGKAGGYGSDIVLRGIVNSNAGNATLVLRKHDNEFSGRIETDRLNIGEILADKRFENIATRIDVKGNIPTNGELHIKAKGDISNFGYNNYTYKNISVNGEWNNGAFDGMFQIKDPNADISMNGKFNFTAKKPYAKLTADVKSLNLSAINLSNRWKNTQFGFRLMADIAGKSLNTANGRVELTNFTMLSENKNYHLAALSVDIGSVYNTHSLNMKSDFGEVTLMGKYDYSTILQSITNLVGSKLPTMPGLPRTTAARTNNFSIAARIENTDWLHKIFNIPLELKEQVRINGSMSDTGHALDLMIDAPNFRYNGKRFDSGALKIITINDTLNVSAQIRTIDDNEKKFYVKVQAQAADNKLSSILTFNNLRTPLLRGHVNTETVFYKNAKGQSVARIDVKPSDIMVGDTIWKVQPSEVSYSQNNITFNKFAVSHHNQHIIIDGAATKNPADSVAIDLKDVDVSYILNLVNFHSVEFSGLASGTAVVKTLFSKPEAYAKLSVKNFKFEEGDMGTLFAGVKYNSDKGQIDIDAVANDGPNVNTFINGYVSPKHNNIDLGIRAENTSVAFLESFCKSFMKDVKANATGEVRLSGLLSNINLTGQLVANGSFTMTPLNTTYTLKNAVVSMVPDEIALQGEQFVDAHGNTGTLSGYIRHESLTNLSYDLNVEANKLLVYDFKDFGENTFYGTVFATGNCSIKGKSGEVNIDINATPERNSTLVYNVASPETVNNSNFIHWGEEAMRAVDDKTGKNKPTNESKQQEVDIPTDIRLNFLINCTPDATIRLLMDRKTGDYITLNGNGAIRATYYNKGAFDMFGNYIIEHGIYKLTVQNVIKKDFSFQQGSTIAFGGDPYRADLNMKAIYTANGVSLSDLNIGSSFSNNTIRVNCLMNITGTPSSPKLSFDIDLPTVNSNVKQMVYSFINGEEEMNQQVLYLLAVGRFYTQGRNNAGIDNTQNRTSLAMQSLLSSTLSQQLNNVLGTVINNTNWNFGTNISTGDEGWNNAEYEGILNGRLLNNRLLVNGQFGYRDNANATTSFIGDFDIRYLLFPSGSMAIRMYNQTNDRYFTRNSLNTQGMGLILKKDFSNWRNLFGWMRKKKSSKPKEE